MYRYQITLMESERGWGKSEWTEDYDTRQQAYDRIVEVNSRNTSTHAPDYYVQAYTDIVPVYIPKHRRDV